MWIKTISSIAAITSITACATSPVAKQPLPESMYENYTMIPYAMERCAFDGHLTPSEAADAAYVFREFIESNFLVDNQKSVLTENIIREKRPSITRTDCIQLAMLSHDHKQMMAKRSAQETAKNRAIRDAIESINANKPVQTYCNRIGSQLICNSY